jgi:hypothetical protein
MIEGYSDHAANERTFLAWVRTGVAPTAWRCSNRQRYYVALARRRAPLSTSRRSECAGGDKIESIFARSASRATSRASASWSLMTPRPDAARWQAP